MLAIAIASCVASSLALTISDVRQNLPQPVVKDPISNITYQGSSSSSGQLESFLNIQFGQDTGGQNRFAAPKPYTHVRGSIVNATSPGAACPQQKVPVPSFSVFSNVTNWSENCLTLRIDRPVNTTAGSKLPVLLWIYGGGDTIGQIYDQTYDPTGLVLGAAEKGLPIVYAAVNYRLGFFGFSAFEHNNSTAVPNAGLLDQQLGMQWIHDNIALFGGDPDNITIFGESDGATAVGLHITAYGGARPPLFKQAIMESGGPTADTGVASNYTWSNTKNLTNVLQCSGDGNIATSIDCLRSLSLSEILPTEINFTKALDAFSGFDVFIPVVDHDFLPASPSDLLRSGRFARNITVIHGWNEDDGALFTPEPPNFVNSSFLPEWLAVSYPGLNESTIQTVLELYAANSTSVVAGRELNPSIPTDWFRASLIQRDTSFVCPAILMAQSVQAYDNNTSVYMYDLNSTLFSPVLAEANASYLGVIHFSDIPYVFNQAMVYNTTDAQIALSSRISGSWVQFAYTGVPTASTMVEKANPNFALSNWPAAVGPDDTVTDVNGLTIRLIGGAQPGTVHIGENLPSGQDFEDIGRRCAFWNSPSVIAQYGD